MESETIELNIPLGLQHALESHNCVLFIGAGVGAHLKNKDGVAPDGRILANELATYFSIDADSESINDLRKIAQLVEITKGRSALISFLKTRLSDLEPDEVFQWLFSLRWKAIYTTNYDNGILRAYELLGNPVQQPISVTRSHQISDYDQRIQVPVYYLHGSLYGDPEPEIVITDKDYSIFQEQRKMVFRRLKLDFATSNFVYVGYSNNDTNWKMILDEVTQEFSPSQTPVSYRVSPNTSSIDELILKDRRIETIHSNLSDFVTACRSTLDQEKLEQDHLDQYQKKLPHKFNESFAKNPAAVIRFLASWEFVNDAPFDVPPNVQDFLQGDRPNWALVGSDQHFERDLEESIFEDMLDFATSTSSAQPNPWTILGSAGYGMTTLLMSIGARLVKEKCGLVFMLKPGHNLTEGNVEFILNNFEEKMFFLIDNAADYKNTIELITHRCKETKKSAMFLLADRINEWRQTSSKLSVKERLVEALSDPEINRLLDCLGKHGALNQLESLDRDLQFTAIKEKHGKELLVAMREAAEAKNFDAIIESEFRGINNDVAQRMYLISSCFYQLGMYVRDQLLADILEINQAELYEEDLSNATAGIIFFECLNESQQRYGARTRHRIIAEIIWQRCGNNSEKGEIVQKAISNFNLNFGNDINGFENFIKSDKIVDILKSFDEKVQFFEIASKKDPKSPYVRQHYARMLLREGQMEKALNKIEEALELSPKARVLYHTKGCILSELAKKESTEVARKRMVQSEDAFRHALKIYKRDEYAYQGLAQLYIAWARKMKNIDLNESMEYLTKAEEVINEGIGVVRVRDSLWIESSNIQKLIGNQPDCLKKLEKAIEDNPDTKIARYLLGRSYRHNGEYKKAVDVLYPVIQKNFDQFRYYIEYSVCLSIIKKEFKEAIGVLNLSRVHGLSNARYIATLGGMLLLDGQNDPANQVFEESKKHNFPATELYAVQYQPINFDDPNEFLRMSGKVIVVRAGFSVIESSNLPSLICPGSKWNGVRMEPGLRVTFEPAFSARGPLAINPIVAT